MLNVFADLVRQRMEGLVTFGDRRKSIVMPTPMRACNILLTEAELADLNHLLQIADTEMKAAALIRLFGSG